MWYKLFICYSLLFHNTYCFFLHILTLIEKIIFEINFHHSFLFFYIYTYIYIHSDERTELIHTHSLIKNKFVHGYIDITQKIEMLMLVTDRRRRMSNSNSSSSSSSSTGKRKRRRNNNILEISDYDVFLGKHLIYISLLYFTLLYLLIILFLYMCWLLLMNN